MRILFLVAIGVAGWLIYRLYLQQLLAQGRAGRIKLGLIALGLVFLALAVTGRAPALFAVLGALMTQAMRFWPLLVRFAPGLVRRMGVQNPFGAGYAGPGGAGGQGGPGGPGGAASQVRTATIVMTLEHASGAMDGEVLAGPARGRALSALGTSELTALHAYCREHDAEALRLLEAYVARERAAEFEGEGGVGGAGGFGAGGRADGAAGGSTEGGRAPRGGPMTVAEATEILGLAPGADRDAVIDAHRKLMSRLHPDKGGSDYLATKVNAARKVLLDALGQHV